MKKGFWHAVGAYGMWGLLPIYWKWLHKVPALQLISHRIVWSSLMLGGIVFLSRRRNTFYSTLNAKTFRIHFTAAVLIGINWLTYVWAVNAGFVVETSLGYFINPLISVLLGVIFLRERPRPWQWAALGLALIGVLYLTAIYGSLPWIALTLAFSFGLYGLVKKIAPLGSIHGLTLEAGLLFLPALLYMLVAGKSGQGAFLRLDSTTDALLIGTGVVTSVPLVLFASAAQRIPLTLMGLLQYIAPTLQLIIGVLIFHEPFTPHQFIGFGMVWTALVILGIESLIIHRTVLPVPVSD